MQSSYVDLEYIATFDVYVVGGIASLQHIVEGRLHFHVGVCTVIAEKRKLVVCCVLSGWFSLQQLFCISPVAVESNTPFRRAGVVERMLVGAGLYLPVCVSFLGSLGF